MLQSSHSHLLAFLALVSLRFEPLAFVSLDVDFEGLEVSKGSVAVPTTKG